MAAFFVTGAGTDIGKTWAAAQLLRYWRLKGLEPEAIKPVASGYDPARPEESDAAALLTALGRVVTAETVAAMTPVMLRAPLSPDQAARREGAFLSARASAMDCGPLLKRAQGPVLVEGAGGIMAPLNDRETMLDLAAELRLPVIFLAASHLGAISHALTGLHALVTRGLVTPLVLVNETPGSTVDLHETAETLASHARSSKVLAVPRGADGPVWAEASRILGVEV